MQEKQRGISQSMQAYRTRVSSTYTWVPSYDNEHLPLAGGLFAGKTSFDVPDTP